MSNGTSGGIFVCTMTNESCQKVVDSSTTGMLISHLPVYTYFMLSLISPVCQVEMLACFVLICMGDLNLSQLSYLSRSGIEHST